MKRIFFILILSLFVSQIFSQVIIGRVVDFQNEPLVGANVVEKGTNNGVSTEANGRFSLEISKKPTVLVFSFVGYLDFELEIDKKTKNQNIGDIILTISKMMSSEVIVSATRADDLAPVANTIIDAAALEERNFSQDLPYMLELTPSFVATSESGTGIGYTNYRIRGTDPTRINVTVNGMPLNDAESQTIFWVNMPDFGSSVSSVQITRGVGTSTNGAASFGGSMNFLTGNPNNKPYAQVSLIGGSFNTFKQSISAGTGLINNGLSFDLRLSNVNSDGYVENAFAKNQSVMFTTSWRNEKSLLRANFIHGRQRTGISWWGCPEEMLEIDRTYNPAGEYFDNQENRKYYKDQTDNYIQTHYQLLYSYMFNDKIDISAGLHYTRGDGYYEQYKEDAILDEYGLPNVIVQGLPVIIGIDTLNSPDVLISESDIIQRKMMGNNFYGGTLSANYKSEKLRVSLGGAGNIYDGVHFGNIIWMSNPGDVEKDFEWYRNTGTKVSMNVFAKLNYQVVKDLFAYGDIQYRHINYDMSGKDYDLMPDGDQKDLKQTHSFDFINPKAGLYYFINPKMKAYVSFAISNREPTRTNFKDATGDPNKTPMYETLNDIELGYIFQKSNLNFGMNLYYMDYKNQLVPTGEKSSVGYDIMTNVPESYRAGVEFSAGIKPHKMLSIDANCTFSQNKIKNFTSWATAYDEMWNETFEAYNLGETDIAYSPNIIASGIVSFKPITGFNISWISKYVGDQFFDNTSNENRMLDAYLVNNLQLDYTFTTNLFSEIQIKFLINNILNVDYSNNAYGGIWYEQGLEQTWAYYYPQAGINFMIGVVLKF
ncbi:MAG: TonB-dependent receptor [Bacteroidales bacterium]|nr:TonB-dependent receptor [Bacteroidales bacterium]